MTEEKLNKAIKMQSEIKEKDANLKELNSVVIDKNFQMITLNTRLSVKKFTITKNQNFAKIILEMAIEKLKKEIHDLRIKFNNL